MLRGKFKFIAMYEVVHSEALSVGRLSVNEYNEFESCDGFSALAHRIDNVMFGRRVDERFL